VTQTVQEYFETLPSRVPAQNTAGMTNSYLFDIKKVGTWLVAVDDGKVTVSEGEGDADARITMSEDVFQKLVAGEQNPMRAVMTGKIKVKGSMGAAAKLQKILAPPEGSAEAAAPAMPRHWRAAGAAATTPGWASCWPMTSSGTAAWAAT
jgi:putative sterol carrier protein